MKFACEFEAAADQVQSGFWSGDAFLGFLLKGMQNVDGIGELDGVDRSIGVAIEVVHDFQNSRTAEADSGLAETDLPPC